jgi:hypothetical protein
VRFLSCVDEMRTAPLTRPARYAASHSVPHTGTGGACLQNDLWLYGVHSRGKGRLRITGEKNRSGVCLGRQPVFFWGGRGGRSRPPRTRRAAFRKRVPTFSDSRGLGRGTQKTKKGRCSSEGAQLNACAPLPCAWWKAAECLSRLEGRETRPRWPCPNKREPLPSLWSGRATPK